MDRKRRPENGRAEKGLRSCYDARIVEVNNSRKYQTAIYE